MIAGGSTVSLAASAYLLFELLIVLERAQVAVRIVELRYDSPGVLLVVYLNASSYQFVGSLSYVGHVHSEACEWSTSCIFHAGVFIIHLDHQVAVSEGEARELWSSKKNPETQEVAVEGDAFRVVPDVENDACSRKGHDGNRLANRPIPVWIAVPTPLWSRRRRTSRVPVGARKVIEVNGISTIVVGRQVRSHPTSTMVDQAEIGEPPQKLSEGLGANPRRNEVESGRISCAQHSPEMQRRGEILRRS